jgi:hypothetical protein
VREKHSQIFKIVLNIRCLQSLHYVMNTLPPFWIFLALQDMTNVLHDLALSQTKAVYRLHGDQRQFNPVTPLEVAGHANAALPPPRPLQWRSTPTMLSATLQRQPFQLPLNILGLCRHRSHHLLAIASYATTACRNAFVACTTPSLIWSSAHCYG